MLALGIALLLQASAADNGSASATFHSYLQDERWTFAVTRKALRYAPSWHADAEDAPPLPPRQAVKVAKEKLAEWLPDGAGWRLSRIVLHPAGDGWVYLVEFAPSRQGLHSTFGVVVLMDGTIVSPQREPWRQQEPLAVAEQAPPPNVTGLAAFYSYLQDERWTFAVTREALRHAPSWDAAVEDAPPLPPGQALKVAKEKLAEWLPDGATWRLSRIVLHPAGDGWVYSVEFGPARQAVPSLLHVAVLMDGTVVSPEREPWQPQEPRGRQPPSPQPHRVQGEIKEPKKVKDVTPDYPGEAIRAGLRGTVVLECVIDTDGRVGDTRLLSGVPPLSDAAIKAVKKWRYRPTLLNGFAVPVVMTVTVTFKREPSLRLDDLLHSLKSTNEFIRESAALWLGTARQPGSGVAPDERLGIVQELRDLVEHDNSERVRVAAARAIAHLEAK